MIVNKNQLKSITGVDYYDGTVLHDRFAYNFLRKKVLPIGNIISFATPTIVDVEGMIDKEDVLSNDFIHSDMMMNFIWEIPILRDPFGAVCFQRLFNTQIGHILSTKNFLNKPIELDGDDIIVHEEFEGSDGELQQKGKASVSITYIKHGVTLGHTGINIDAGIKAPSFAFSTKFDEDKSNQFMNLVEQTFYEMCDDMFIAGTKVIG